MDAHPSVAGAFGRQEPHPDADPLEAFEVRSHFDTFRDGEEFRLVPGSVRQHYFSNVNSCIRRAAWERVAFPEIEFGEDQAWALEAQQAGLATGHAREAVVRHSHDYGALALFGRRYDEARFMRRRFGYALMPTWRQAVATARAHTRLYRGALAPGVRARPGPAGRAWAIALGHWAGTRFADRDGPVHRMISLTERRLRA
jgi:rhamnosyltransferase